MGVLFAATEAESFVMTTPTQFFARSEEDHDFATSGHGLSLAGTAVGATTFTAQTELWVSVNAAIVVSNVSNTQAFLRLYDTGAAQIICQIDMDANGAASLEYWSGAAYTEVGAPFPVDQDILTAGQIHRYTIHAKIADASGFFRMYVDDVLWAEFTGDTKLGAITQCDQVQIAAANSGTGTGAGTTFSEVIVSTTPVWGDRVFSLLVTGAGTNTAWTGVNTDVDDVAVVNDTDLITDNLNADKESYACTNITGVTEPNKMIPELVIVAFRGQNSGSGVANIKHLLRSGGTDYMGAAVTGIGTTLSPYQNIWTTDPNGGITWTNANIDAIEIGAEANT